MPLNFFDKTTRIFDRRTYQTRPDAMIHTDIAERYQRSLTDYRRATGQNPKHKVVRSYLKQNSRGLLWIGLMAGIGAGAYIITQFLSHDSEKVNREAKNELAQELA